MGKSRLSHGKKVCGEEGASSKLEEFPCSIEVMRFRVGWPSLFTSYGCPNEFPTRFEGITSRSRLLQRPGGLVRPQGFGGYQAQICRETCRQSSSGVTDS